MGNMKIQRGKWFMMPKLIYDMEGLSGRARLVYGYLCRLADEDNTAFPSYSKIRKACDIGSDQTVSKVLKELIAAGLLKKEVRFRKDGSQGSNMYTIITEIPDDKEVMAANDEERKFLEDLKPILKRYSYDVILDMLANFAESKKENCQEEQPEAEEEQPEAENKKPHGHNQEVLLTDEEYINLKKEYESGIVADFIEQLDSRIASHGEQDKYINHYATLRRWIERDKKEK